MTPEPDQAASRLAQEHRDIEALLELFFESLAASDPVAAEAAIGGFDDALRRHTAFEDERLPPPAGRKLVGTAEEGDVEREARARRLEGVQMRELSGILRRLLAERRDLASVPGLAANLARRWDAHAARPLPDGLAPQPPESTRT